MDFQTIPIMRIFDEEKAKDFYLGYLGMQLDWAHRFAAELPNYRFTCRRQKIILSCT
ncbi:glyoxalase superfamily protein [Zhongshania sp.]|uniref:glyoxalase superfamily protein n=1 Tax=Zhongshania sp. TaxID=1971902 RepID=UPI0035627BB8